ncbi:MAG TPA: hypothetical protein VM513_04585 [Kofleriaceae bacterium]|nr:hypothetical protein [Kofleriaceae bacterium]
MRDDQVHRYSRHILLPDVGGLGQTALFRSIARVTVSRDPAADVIAATYLAAGGVGTLSVTGATDDELATIAKAGPDTHVIAGNAGAPGTNSHGTEVVFAPQPAWWPSTEGDTIALAFWRGGEAAVRWMADVANR